MAGHSLMALEQYWELDAVFQKAEKQEKKAGHELTGQRDDHQMTTRPRKHHTSKANAAKNVKNVEQ